MAIVWFIIACLILGLAWGVVSAVFEKFSATDVYGKYKKQLIGLLVLLAVAFIAFFMPGSTKWDGEGTISAFPEDAAAKNYRLSSNNIEVTKNKRGWFHKELSYKVSGAEWPDGGELNFEPACIIKYPATSALCDSNAGKFRIEIAVAPSEPGTGGNSDEMGY